MEGCIAKTKDIYQIVSVVRDLDQVMKNWFAYVEFNTDSIKYYTKDAEGREGVEVKGSYQGHAIAYRVKAVRFDFGGVDLMLVEPLNKEGGDPYSDYLKAYGNGFHHITLNVDNFDEAIQKYAERNYQPYMVMEGVGNRQVVFDLQNEMGPIMALTPDEIGPLGPRTADGKTI